MEEGQRNSFTFPASPLPQDGTAQRQERPSWPMIFPMEEKQSIWVTTWLPSHMRCCPRGLLLFPLTQVSEVCRMIGEKGAAARTAARALKGHSRDTDPTHHFADSIRKAAQEPLGMPHQQIPPADPWALPVLCAPHPHTISAAAVPRPTPCACPCGWWEWALANG